MDKFGAMRILCRVVDLGSFSQAANSLGVPSTRISQLVSDLESELGVRLLQRSTRVMKLTVDGAAYVERCRQILDDVDELEASMSGAVSAPKGYLRVDAQTSICRWLLAPRLTEFRRRYPMIQLHLGVYDRARHLLENGIDCAIRSGHLNDSSLIARHLMDVSFQLYASPGYLERFGVLDSPGRLEQADLLGWFNSESNAAKPWCLYSEDVEYDLKKSPGLVFDDPESAVSAALEGGGITLSPRFAVDSHIAQGQLVPVLPAWHFMAQPVHIVYPTSRHLSARVRAFVDWAVEVICPDGAFPRPALARSQQAPDRRPG